MDRRRIRVADSRGRPAADGRLGEEEGLRERLLRRDLDGISWSESAGKNCEGVWRVREARDTATDLIRKHVAAGKPLQGWQVDKAARRVIEKAGYGKYFFHRTGHSIGERVHGNGANMDGLETHDVRHLIPHTCNSIEPGSICRNLACAAK